MRGIRGAITVSENSKPEILSATQELLQKMIQQNTLDISEIASIFFTVTEDLDAEFPAAAARELGFEDTPLLCAREIPVPGSLPKCIRVLIHYNTNKSQKEIKHVYLKQAVTLRPDKA